MFSKVFAILATLAVVANTQTTFADLSPCALACVIPGAKQNGCDNPQDAQCVCASVQIVADVTQCLTAHCTPEDIAAVLAVQTAQCTAAGVTATGTPTGVNTIPFTLASSAASSASASTSASASANATSSTGGAATSASSASSAASSATSPAPSATESTGQGSGAAVFGAKNVGIGAVVVAVVAGVFAL